jgi:hypothetical protein
MEEIRGYNQLMKKIRGYNQNIFEVNLEISGNQEEMVSAQQINNCRLLATMLNTSSII